MADTLLTVVKNVARRIGWDPAAISTFSDDDETNLVVEYINDAYMSLISDLQAQNPYVRELSSVTTTASTRTVALPSNVHTLNLITTSFEDETNGDTPLKFATPDFIQETYPKYDEDTGKPVYVYFDGGDTLGFYPVPDGDYVVKFNYKISNIELASPSATFEIPDEWLRYIELEAELDYLDEKGFEISDRKINKAEDARISILAEDWNLNPTYMLPYKQV
jgi:hypothetical protein